MPSILQDNKLKIPYNAGPTAFQAHQERKRVKAVYGPWRSSKSTFACFAIVRKAAELAKINIGLKALMVRDTFSNLKDSTLKTWLEWFPHPYFSNLHMEQGRADLTFNYGGQKHSVLFRHGQTAQAASDFLSTDYGVIVLEEVVPVYNLTGNQQVSPGISEEVFKMCSGRLAQWGVDEPELILTFNPPMSTHWTNTRFIALTKTSRGRAELDRLNCGVYFFSRQENEKNLRKGYYDETAATLGDDTMIRRFINGEVISVYPGLPIFQKDFRYERHVRDQISPIQSRGFILGFDNPPHPACLFTQVDAKGRWLWIKELLGGYVHERLVEDIGMVRFSDMVKAALGAQFPTLGVDSYYYDPSCDSPGVTDESSVGDILRQKFAPVPGMPGLSPIPPRIESIRNRLNHSIDGDPALLVSAEGCPMAVEALAGGYRYGLKPSGTALMGYDPVKDVFSDIIDAAGYIGSRLFWGNVLSRLPKPTKAEPSVDSEVMGW